MPRKSPYALGLATEQRLVLESRARQYTLPYRDVVRAKIVLMAAAGMGNDEVAARLGTRQEVVSKWRKRFFYQALRASKSSPGVAVPRSFPAGVVVAVKAFACELPARLGLPLSRLHVPDIASEVVSRGIVAEISGKTVWRWLSEDAIKPWRHRRRLRTMRCSQATVPGVGDSGLATFKRLAERVQARWSWFQDRREQHLRQGDRYGTVPERAAEEIIGDLLTGVLDWTPADLNAQVEGADIVVTRLGIKHLVVEAKRPGALSYGSSAFEEALGQAHRYAKEQRVASVAVSDGRMFYAEDLVYDEGGNALPARPRTYFELDGEADVASLWWLSLNGIYRLRPDAELGMCRPLAEQGVARPSPGTGHLHPKYRLPAQCFGFVGDPFDPKTWHLPYLRADGSVDLSRLPKAIQALLTNYRGAVAASVPEAAVPSVLARLAAAARSAGRMPGQCAKPAQAYVRLAKALEQVGRSAQPGQV